MEDKDKKYLINMANDVEKHIPIKILNKYQVTLISFAPKKWGIRIQFAKINEIDNPRRYCLTFKNKSEFIEGLKNLT